MKPRKSYKVTFFDRHGPAGADAVKALGHGLMVFGLSLLMFLLAGFKLELSGLPLIGFMLIGSITFGAAAAAFGLISARGAGAAAEFLSSGAGTPYEEQFSQEQALIMQRDYAGAAACFEQRIQLGMPEPDVRVLLAAADLYRELAANPARSAELYRMAQRSPALTPGQDVYVANKLADLYLGPLKQPGKALVEFRRLIERYPGSRTADQARMALKNIKADLVAEREG